MKANEHPKFSKVGSVFHNAGSRCEKYFTEHPKALSAVKLGTTVAGGVVIGALTGYSASNYLIQYAENSGKTIGMLSLEKAPDILVPMGTMTLGTVGGITGVIAYYLKKK